MRLVLTASQLRALCQAFPDPEAPSIQVNALVVAQTPEFEQVMRCVLDELQSVPKVRQRVIERVRAEIDKQRAACRVT